MNQTPEQISRDNIDKQLTACGWIVQSKKKINLGESLGVAVREYQTDVGPAGYVLFYLDFILLLSVCICVKNFLRNISYHSSITINVRLNNIL